MASSGATATSDTAPTDRPGERARLAAVRRYAILDTPADGAFDRVAGLAARIFDVPMASVTIVDRDRIWFKAQQGLPPGISEIVREAGLCASAILDGRPYVVTDARRDPRTARHALVRGEPGVRFYAAAPITSSGGHRLGTVNIMDTRPRRIGDRELATLADLAAVVMDELELRLSAMRTLRVERDMRIRVETERARLAHLASVLQRTLLPPALPRVPGLDVAAHYEIASADQVGGDFYDLFPLGGRRWGFFLGDVCGKGPEAAALTSLARYTLRSAAVHNPDPVAVLRILNTVLLHEQQGDDPRYCTVLFGLLAPDGDGFAVTLAGGGHPPALLLRREGTVEPLHPPGGQLIGVLPDPHMARITVRMRPGDGLLLHSDGLTEARTPGGGMLGEEGLRKHLAGSRPAAAGADGVLTDLRKLLVGLDARLWDDTALLALVVPRA
ncbi:GAF domain-containing SpoIIE family protein phosphatase [Streptomyces sp. NPDC002055]|uniref:PP2C family protein-serine/threonine phosphatase n=1 Tax=Streptomyces sp. NPDC002055 TaxID=3154534 RepID=UPI00331B7420